MNVLAGSNSCHVGLMPSPIRWLVSAVHLEMFRRSSSNCFQVGTVFDRIVTYKSTVSFVCIPGSLVLVEVQGMHPQRSDLPLFCLSSSFG